MGKRSVRRAIARLASRHRLLRDLRQRAAWADEARTAPPLRCWLDACAGEPGARPHRPPAAAHRSGAAGRRPGGAGRFDAATPNADLLPGA